MTDKYKLLIVDDEPLNLIILEEILVEEQDYIISSVDNGDDCLLEVEKNTPDLILLDVNMPGTDGISVCKTLRADKRYDDVRIIFVSALASEKEKESGFAAGGNDYITKPFIEDDLLDVVRKYLVSQ